MQTDSTMPQASTKCVPADSRLYAKIEQEAHRNVGLGESTRRLIRKRGRYSSLEKFEDAFDAVVVHLSFVVSSTISEL